MFEFLEHTFDHENFIASFRYKGPDDTIFCERIKYQKTDFDFSGPRKLILDRAMFLAHIIIGTSYYKAHPTSIVVLKTPLDRFQTKFFNSIFQEGLSQFAYENNLTRDNLAHFISTSDDASSTLPYDGKGILCGQSGGKDSLLVAKLLTKKDLPWTATMISSTENYPEILDSTGAKDFKLILRKVDTDSLSKTGGLNGHVPVTYINMAIMLIQGILNGDNAILTSIGHEGAEPHAYIGDLPVNHQWSKTWEAEQFFSEYVHHYISEDIFIGSPLRQFTELKIAELFVNNCWAEYGHKFSSCNVANYKQGANNQNLTWCGLCAKCANSYLLFMPFIEPEELNLLFPEQKSLLKKSELYDDFKGLLGIDGAMKPFECIGEIKELRKAYHMRQTGYPELPFPIPDSDFNYHHLYPAQKQLTSLLEP